MDEHEIIIQDNVLKPNIIEEAQRTNAVESLPDFILSMEPIEELSVSGSEIDANIDYSNHATLTNRDLPNQHPISAITNLNSELDELKRIKPILAPAGTIAMYYPWVEPSLSEDRVGYFIECVSSNIGEIGGIQIATGEHEIIGVSVSQAGYSGNYAKTVIDGIEVGREND